MPSRAPRPTIRVLTPGGVQFVSGLSATQTSLVAQHWNAVRRYLETGDDEDLADLDGLAVGGHPLETRPDGIEAQAIRGEVDFESIYDEVS